jgi:hypothetical protein
LVKWKIFSGSRALNKSFKWDKSLFSYEVWLKDIFKLLKNKSYQWDFKSLSRLDSINWNVALYHFCCNNNFSRSISLIPVNYSPIRNLPKNPLLDLNIMGYDEQLDLAIRQEYFIKPVIRCGITIFVHSRD